MQTIGIRMVRREGWIDVAVGEEWSGVGLVDLAPFFELSTEGDVARFGTALLQRAFTSGQIERLRTLGPGARILLDVADPRLAAIPWEAMRFEDGELVAARCALTRWTAAEGRSTPAAMESMLNLVAIPVAPADGYQPFLATEREYRGLQSTVAQSAAAVRLVRVRPPTLEATGRALRPGMPNGIFFMGHSDSREGRSVLAFEDGSARTRLIEARDLAAVLTADVAFVVLNSCWSAKAGSATELGNIARGLVQMGIPHALGMQSELPDDAAILLSRELLRALLSGSPFEEAVRNVRAFFAGGSVPNRAWIAAVPVCYTARRTPAAPLVLARGAAEIEPSPDLIAARMELSDLRAPEELIGRGHETSETLDALLGGIPVVLHGLGGIGKSSLARAVAERVSWRYDDRVLAIGFDALDERFPARLMGRLARFYGVDAAALQDPDMLAARLRETSRETKALLVLDNIETLFEAPERDAASLAAFVRSLGEGETDLLLTSRVLPPSSWGACRVVDVRGLAPAAGAALFRSLLPAGRREAAGVPGPLRLAARVEGHPLAIRLLAGQFAAGEDDLDRILERLDDELARTGDSPAGEGDRQATLNACMRYSVERLDAAAQGTLETLALFQAPFMSAFAASLLDASTEAATAALDLLVRRGLVALRRETWGEEGISLYEIHQTVRWYLRRRSGGPPSREVLDRFARTFLAFAKFAEESDALTRSRWVRRVVFGSFPDLTAALHLLEPLPRAQLAYLITRPLEYIGQIAEARRLAESALEIAEEHDDALLTTAALLKIADLMTKMGERPAAITPLYDRAASLAAQLGPETGASSLVHAQVGELLLNTDRPEEALAHFRLAREALVRVAIPDPTLRRLKEAETDYMIARALGALRRDEEALELFTASIQVLLTGSTRAASVALDSMAQILDRRKRHAEALSAYERAVSLMEDLGDARAAAVIRGNLAMTLLFLRRVDEGQAMLVDAATVLRESGDALQAAPVEERLSMVLHAGGDLPGAIRRLWDAHRTYRDMGLEADLRRTIEMFREMKAKSGVRVFGNWWRSIAGEPEPPWLADVENDPEAPLGQARLAQKALETALQNTFFALQPGNDQARASWREQLVRVGAEFARDGETTLAAFNAALLALVDGEPARLPNDHPYYIPFHELLASVEEMTERRAGADPELPDMQEAIVALLTAATPEALARCIRQHHELIVRRPEISRYLRMRSVQEHAKGNRELGEAIETCAAMLETLPAEGVEAAVTRIAEAPFLEDASPSGRARRAARAAFGDAAMQQEAVAELEQLIAASTSDEERLFYGGLRIGIVEGQAELMLSFRDPELAEAWDEFRRTLASGIVEAVVFEQLRDAFFAALAPGAGDAAVSACRRLLATLRNDAIAVGLLQFVGLLDALAAVIDESAAGADVLALDVAARGSALRGKYYRVWREMLAAVRVHRRPPMRPELRRALGEYLSREDQTGTLQMLRAHAGELVSDEAIDSLWDLWFQRRGIEKFEKVLETHVRLLEWTRQHGLAAAITRDVVMSFAAVDDPAVLLPVFEVSADLLSAEVADEVFHGLDRNQRGNPAARVEVFRKQRRFRRIVERGAAAAFAEEARLEEKRAAAQAFIIGLLQQVLSPEQQEAHVRAHAELLHDPDMPPLFEEIAGELAVAGVEDPRAAALTHSIGVQMEVLERCRTAGIAAAFRDRRQLLAWLLELANAPASAQREVARLIDAGSPGVLTSEDALELLFQLQEHMRDQQKWRPFRTLRRLLAAHRRWKESTLDTAFDEADAAIARETRMSKIVRELTETDDPGEERAIIEHHADFLLDPWADDHFAEVLEEAEQAGEREVYVYFSYLRDLLRRCRQLGIAEAFSRQDS